MRILILLLTALLLTMNAQKNITSKSSTAEEEKGFYYYDDDNNETTQKKKVPATPAQKMQGELTSELIKEMRTNNKLQAKILEKLEYAFPRTVPKFTTNKKTGEKCISNSSEDCFVMPVITEAQNSVPVMAEMLRNPTTKNVKKYVAWQAVYLNRAFKIGNGFGLVNKQYEREVNKMDGMGYTQRPTDGNLQNDMAFLKKSAIVKKLGPKLGLMVFVGKSRELERNFNGKEYTALLNSQYGEMENLVYVYASQEDKDFVESRINHFKFDPEPAKYAKVRSIVAPDQFERFKINATPSAVLLYTKDDGSMIWQKAGYTIAPQSLLRTTYRFLRFHDIVKPGTINEKDAWNMATTLREGKSFTTEQLNSFDINESSINVEDDQYLKKVNSKEDGKK